MVVPSYKDYFDIPGGYGETPFQAAQPEVHEELGIKPTIVRLLLADWREDSPEADGGAKLLLVFDGRTLHEDAIQQIAADDGEVLGVRFLRLDELDDPTSRQPSPTGLLQVAPSAI